MYRNNVKKNKNKTTLTDVYIYINANAFKKIACVVDFIMNMYEKYVKYSVFT